MVQKRHNRKQEKTASHTPCTFYKYQALGNDFVFISSGNRRSIPAGKKAEISRIVCRRRTGIGSDGLIVISPDPPHAAYMEFFNPDGSQADMCGNGIRCVAQFLKDRELVHTRDLVINTGSGPRKLSFVPEGIAVNLGMPSFSPDALPALFKPGTDLRTGVTLPLPEHLPCPLPPATCLSVGNPHCVFLLQDIEHLPVRTIGPEIENLPVFPERINVIFVEVKKPGLLACRVWERGAGETNACGTGASAALIAASLNTMVPDEAEVKLPGGSLKVRWDRTEGVTIAGEASRVFTGTIALPSALLSAENVRNRSKEVFSF